jgi:hypothetical protein
MAISDMAKTPLSRMRTSKSRMSVVMAHMAEHAFVQSRRTGFVRTLCSRRTACAHLRGKALERDRAGQCSLDQAKTARAGLAMRVEGERCLETLFLRQKSDEHGFHHGHVRDVASRPRRPPRCAAPIRRPYGGAEMMRFTGARM